MKRIIKYGLLALCVALTAPTFISCDDSDDYDTNQYTGGVNLNSFGPSPVARGGQLRFLGSGMDQITKITLPGSGDITSIEVVGKEEIRITVPQDAEPGTVTLHYAGGTIETKTILTFSEPISIESISPMRVKPGSELTISGEYLNLIKEVSFAFATGRDSVNVYAPDFKSHSRSSISLIVPAEAVSGVITISDAKEMPNIIKSETEVDIILPSVDKTADLTDAKGGDEVVIEGHDLDLVTAIYMPSGEEVDFEYVMADGRETVSFILPDNTTDGAIAAETASGVSVALANIGMVVPTLESARPSEGLRGGDKVVVTGINMDQIVSVVVPGVEEAIEPASVSPTSIEFIFPEGGRSGEAELRLKSGKNVNIYLVTAKPEVTGFNPDPVSAAAQFTVSGKNLDLVTEVVFAGVETPVVVSAPAADSFTLTAPALATSGPLTLMMANGESVETKPLTINAPECANIVGVETAEPVAGQIMIVSVANGDKLTSVEVNGQAVQYIINGDKLYISLPSSCGAATVVKLVSSNGEISYTYDVIPASHVEKVVCSEIFDLGNWDGGGLRIYKDALEGVPAGAVLVFHLAPYTDAQIQVNDANWGQMGDVVDVAQTDNRAEFTLTSEFLNRALTTSDGWSETAFVINGKGAVINKITVEYEQSLETAIWEGEWTCTGWNGNQDLAWDGYDWSSVKPGTKMRIYMTPTVANPEEDWWVISLRSGAKWGNLQAPIPDQYGRPGRVLEVELPANIVEELKAENGLVITGDGFILNKVTLE